MLISDFCCTFAVILVYCATFAMAEHNLIGTIGEDIAARLVRKQGLRIRERNWKMGHLEVDIIAENRKEIVFVEVKTRTSTFGGKRAEEYVDANKKRRIIAAANAYIRYHEIDKSPRFDIVGILLDRNTHEVKEQTYLSNAFSPRCRTIGGSGAFSGICRWLHRNKIIR